MQRHSERSSQADYGSWRGSASDRDDDRRSDDRGRGAMGARDFGQGDYGSREGGRGAIGDRDFGQGAYGNRDFGNRDYGNQDDRRGGQRGDFGPRGTADWDDYGYRDYGRAESGYSAADMDRGYGSSTGAGPQGGYGPPGGSQSSYGQGSGQRGGQGYGARQRDYGGMQGGYSDMQRGYGNQGGGNQGGRSMGDDWRGGWNTAEQDWPSGVGRERNQGQHQGRGPQGYSRSTERITEDVCERLTWNGDLDATHIRVRAENGEVTLEGTVQSRHDKRLAESLAEQVRGVHDVHNHLRVQREQDDRSRSSSDSMRSASEERIGQHPSGLYSGSLSSSSSDDASNGKGDQTAQASGSTSQGREENADAKKEAGKSK